MATKDKSTITGGLGLEEKFFEQGHKMVVEVFQRTETVSDTLEELAKEIRDETLGEVDTPITTYEKKLMLVGFLSGVFLERMSASNSLLKMLGKINPDGDESEG